MKVIKKHGIAYVQGACHSDVIQGAANELLTAAEVLETLSEHIRNTESGKIIPEDIEQIVEPVYSLCMLDLSKSLTQFIKNLLVTLQLLPEIELPADILPISSLILQHYPELISSDDISDDTHEELPEQPQEPNETRISVTLGRNHDNKFCLTIHDDLNNTNYIYTSPELALQGLGTLFRSSALTADQVAALIEIIRSHK